MKKILLITFMFVTALVTQSWAQDRVISGKVTSAEDGSALPGVNVVLKGTTTGTATDIDGNFKFSAPGEGGTLIFSFIGLTSKEVTIGNQSTINVVMASDAKQLSEVVVTALGLTREKAALGYGVTTVSSDDIQARPEADVARVLRGKVPGVDITSTSGIAGTGTNIIIRGYTSITGGNQPLFVVDGVPFNTDTNSDRGFTAGGATASSRFLDLDPNNIANISILKGLSATVLYGEAGRNGVVLVTTKTGSGGASAQKKMEISFSQSYNVNEVGGIPDTQDSYGNGWQNAAAAAFSNWGAPFNKPGFNGIDADGTIGHPYDRAALNDALPQYVGARYPYKPYNNLEPFFVKGSQVNTSLNVTSALSDVSSVSVGYGYLKDGGYIPNNDYTKHNFSAGFNTKLKNGLSVRISANFIGSDSNKPPAAPIFSSNPISGTSLFSNVLYTPRSVDLHGLEYANPVDGSSIYYRGGNDIQHPLWTLNNSNDQEVVRRFFGNISLGYKLTDWLNVSYRMGVDTYQQEKDFKINRGGRQVPDGDYTVSERLNLITDQVFNFNVDRNLTPDLNLTALLGVNLRRETRDSHWIYSSEQFILDLFNHDNFGTTTAETFITENITNAVFGEISLGYKDYAYINLLARNDWTSTLEKENRSVFYPSVSVSLLPMEAFGVSTNMVNNLKVRVSYGTSAGYSNPYRTRSTLSTNPKAFKDAGGTVFKIASVSNRFANPDLKPEIHKEFEIGLEGSFFNDRVGLDLSLYKKTSSDLIIELQMDPSTGFSVSTINSASLENKGIELGVNVTPITRGDFNWNFAINFTKNISEITSIADGIDQIVFPRQLLSPANYAIVGQPYGVIQGQGIVRDDNGNPVIGGNGAYQGEPDISIIGDPNPDFNTSLINTLSYKFLSFRVQVDYRKGGDIWGATASSLTGRGIAKETDFDRFVPVITPGVNPDGSPNTKQITSNRHYWENTGVFYDENRMYDGTTVRLREISLTVTAPKNWLSKTPFGSASITFAGQNLWYRAINFPESINFDPEVLSTGVGNGRGFDFVTGPTAKKYGATLSLTF